MASQSLRRGFKAEAERLSLAIRKELGLAGEHRLHCEKLAAHLEIPVVALADLAADGAKLSSIRRLASAAAGFSALTICAGTRRLIVFNAAHAPNRKASSLAHELSHVLLEHPAVPAVDEMGCRRWDGRLEAEADWFAAALLVPRDGAFAWLRDDRTMEDGAKHFGVSTQLFQWRVNQTGILKQLAAMSRKKPI